MKSRKVTMEEVQKAWNDLVEAKEAARAYSNTFDILSKSFDTLVNRTSKEVLAEFVRKGCDFFLCSIQITIVIHHLRKYN